MAKQDKGGKAATGGKAPTATGPVIGITAKKPAFRAGSARALWHTRFTQYDGKTLAAFNASVAASAPSMPTKGKLAGKPEPVSGWVSYMVTQGFVTLT